MARWPLARSEYPCRPAAGPSSNIALRACGAPAHLFREAVTTRPFPRQDFSIQVPQQIGKYLVSPLIHPLDIGRFKASVSIRSGRGSMTHDRVLRLCPTFPSADEAARHAMSEGLAWVDAAARLSGLSLPPTQEPTAWPKKS